MDKIFKTWIYIMKIIPDGINRVYCPSCNTIDLNYQYVGDTASKIGYLDIWCNSCLKGIHVSRVVIPKNVNFISFDSLDEIKNIIPDFTQVTPY